jgi:hypothetical protein
MIEIIGGLLVIIVGIFTFLILCILPIAVIGITLMTALGSIGAAIKGK